MTETFAQRVERLKKNEKHIIFIDMTEEDKAYLRKIGADNCQYLTTVFNANLAWYNGYKGDDFALTCVYRIRPDYQPEPEYVDCIIEVNTSRELIADIPHPVSGNYGTRLISVLPALSGFAGFRLQGDPVIEVQYEYIARKIAEGKTVVARFRKE